MRTSCQEGTHAGWGVGGVFSFQFSVFRETTRSSAAEGRGRGGVDTTGKPESFPKTENRKPKTSFRLTASIAALLSASSALAAPTPGPRSANRLTYLDGADPFHVSAEFPRLVTPQWIGDPGVEVAVIYGIDDLRDTARYENYTRPILDRLKAIDGRAPLSIFVNAVAPDDARLKGWLAEGLSFEVHTLSHPCPILAKGILTPAQDAYHGGVELLNLIPGSQPVAFRTPCCDSIDSASPRLFAELLGRTNGAGQFLRMDSSVAMILTTNDPALPAARLVDPDGRPTFRKYAPFPAFTTTIENYPYPYVVNDRIWEMPFVAPSDWEAQNIHGNASPKLLADWKTALDLVALKQGTFTFVFHPYEWSHPTQHVAFIDHAVATLGSKVKFVTFREANERLTRHLLAGQPLRGDDGGDNGVRLLDLNHDGFLDVIIANPTLRRTRVWNPAQGAWNETDFPVALAGAGTSAPPARFGIIRDDRVSLLARDESTAGAWTFDGARWVEEPGLLAGFELEGQPIRVRDQGRDRGVRFRDVDGDGADELLVANDQQSAVFAWSAADQSWHRSELTLPEGAAFVNARGEDDGLRFVDLNEDGHDDLLVSNERGYGTWLWMPETFLGWSRGWTRKVVSGKRADPEATPAFVREGRYRNNGAWFHSRTLWVQNEDTAQLPNLVDRRSYEQLITGVLPPAKKPAEALASLKVRAGFRVELVASEPLVQDPIALDWDAQGRLWVVEMRDYPLGLDGHGKPGGFVKILHDDNGDGVADRVTEFLRDLPFPTGIAFWRGGVLIATAPDLIYAEDTDGDGRADVKRVLFRGFREGNQQHRFNGFAWGLDGWFYAANGDSGGDIQRVETLRSGAKLPPGPWSLRGSDFRFQPDLGAFEVVEGQTQFGRVRDDWGRWYGNANWTWGWSFDYPARYLARNPHLAVRDTKTLLAQYEGGTRVWQISRPMARPNAVGAEFTVTSACSPMAYRDDLFGPDFATSLFMSEPTENLVHREVLEESGAGLISHRALGEEQSEFLASTDNWFRPTQTKTGPDGALYVADMYRLVIEHPEWIPEDLKRNLDLRAGTDLGRIYRVLPEGAKLRSAPNLAALETPALVAAMDHPNGWQRDTVQRLLIERATPDAVPLLANLARRAESPKVRVQAYATLGALAAFNPAAHVNAPTDRSEFALDPGLVDSALCDPSPRVREQGVLLAEAALTPAPKGYFSRPLAESERILRSLTELARDPDARVAQQLAFALGSLTNASAGSALATIAQQHPADERVRTAILSSALPHLGPLIEALGSSTTATGPDANLLGRLASMAAAAGNDVAVATALRVTLRGLEDGSAARGAEARFAALGGFLDSLDRRSTTLEAFAERVPAQREKLLDGIRAAFAAARRSAPAADVALATRVAATQLLARDAAQLDADLGLLVSLLDAQHPETLQRAALAGLRRHAGPATTQRLLAHWTQLSPARRSEAVEILITRQEGILAILDALESGQLSPHDLGITARQQLVRHPREDLRARATKVLGPRDTERSRLVASYASVRSNRGDREQGRALFLNHCAPCHRVQGVGNDVGPGIATFADKPLESLLTAILDQNRAVDDRFRAFTATTKSGDEFTGVVATETANSVTLKLAGGREETLLRSTLATFQSERLSLMPEGFEAALNPPGMAHLLAFLTSVATPPKHFAGNQPAPVSASANGELLLSAKQAEIRGDSLDFEAQHQNLGFWQSENDRAAWALEVRDAGDYEVELDWAWPGPEPGPRLQLETGDQTLAVPISTTGSWDEYRQAKVGRLTLAAGPQRLVVRGVPPLKGAIVDLRQLRLTRVAR